MNRPDDTHTAKALSDRADTFQLAGDPAMAGHHSRQALRAFLRDANPVNPHSTTFVRQPEPLDAESTLSRVLRLPGKLSRTRERLHGC